MNFAEITFAPQGTLIEMSPKYRMIETVSMKRHLVNGGNYTFVVSRKQPRDKKRGEVVGFSRRSRSRLNKKMAMLKKHHLPLFVTLTYHNDYPDNFEDVKTDLHNFFKRLFYHYPDAGVIWKLEYQKRGAPHFHFLLWGMSLEDACEFIPLAWHEIAGNGSAHHLAWHRGELGNGNRPCVQEIRSWGGVVSYASKYMAKLDNDNRGGRVWGGRGNIPYSSLVTVRVDMEAALEFRYFLAIERKYHFQRVGFWCGDYDIKWVRFLRSLLTQPSCPDEDPPDWDYQEPVLYEHIQLGDEVTG